MSRRPFPTPAERRAATPHLPTVVRRAAMLLLPIGALVASASPAMAVERTEVPIASRSPQTDVLSSVVSLKVPLPASAPAHPAACDWIQYERFRSADGPTDPTKADAVAVLMPGILEGATAFDPVARNAIEAARTKGVSLEVPKGEEAAYREAFPAMLKLLKALYDAGVTIIPGTDALAGYTLHHELELYARAGIAPAEVLRMATLTPAQVMGVTRDRGVIAPGKLADMILVDGDPSVHIADIRHIATVIKDGRVYDPAAIEKALGIAPRAAH